MILCIHVELYKIHIPRHKTSSSVMLHSIIWSLSCNVNSSLKRLYNKINYNIINVLFFTKASLESSGWFHSKDSLDMWNVVSLFQISCNHFFIRYELYMNSFQVFWVRLFLGFTQNIHFSIRHPDTKHTLPIL